MIAAVTYDDRADTDDVDVDDDDGDWDDDDGDDELPALGRPDGRVVRTHGLKNGVLCHRWGERCCSRPATSSSPSPPRRAGRPVAVPAVSASTP
jgi:hypothetical protein